MKAIVQDIYYILHQVALIFYVMINLLNSFFIYALKWS